MEPRAHRPRRRSQPRRPPPGAPPGIFTAQPGAHAPRIVVRSFSEGDFEEETVRGAQRIRRAPEPPGCRWVDVTGLADASAIAAIGEIFSLHELSLEDALDPEQRGKVEHYSDYTFAVLKVLDQPSPIEARPISLFFGDGFVVTLQGSETAALEPVRERLRTGRGKIRARGADYLAYSIIDSVIDHYFPIVESFDDELESVEEAVLAARGSDPVQLARRARADLRTIRHAVWSARDIVTALLREEATRISDETRVHLRDCYDHVAKLQDMIESSREIAASLLEAYLSRVSLQTNEVMRVLTVIATVFIPLTFLTGLYGMNFDPASSPLNMPELRWAWGYPFVLLVMAVTTAGILLYFRKRGWLGRRSDSRRDR